MLHQWLTPLLAIARIDDYAQADSKYDRLAAVRYVEQNPVRAKSLGVNRAVD